MNRDSGNVDARTLRRRAAELTLIALGVFYRNNEEYSLNDTSSVHHSKFSMNMEQAVGYFQYRNSY
jgi:hypothetical protein